MKMKLEFIEQQYQVDAVNATADIFEGCAAKDSLFTIRKKEDSGKLLDEIGYGNACSLGEAEILENLRTIQERQNIKKDSELIYKPYNCVNLNIEMETGTGKTYVYIKTILELNKRFGFTKFIIVVPSIAIKEGVKKSFDVTKDHFDILYNNPTYDYFVYNSEKIDQLKEFAGSTSIQIMIMTIGAFNKDLNLINNPSEKLDGWKGIDLIKKVHPIVIIDEPQSVDTTSKAREAIKTLNPMAILRYSATHKDDYNLIYRLTPVDAYQKHLVKGIYVDEIISDEEATKAYIKLVSVFNNGDSVSDNRAKIEIYYINDKTGSAEKKVITAKTGDNIWELSNYNDVYEAGYMINSIDNDNDNQEVELECMTLKVGNKEGDIDEETIKRSQIKETIAEHFARERALSSQGIKVLSLFFIDKVEKYRETKDGDKGIYFKIFEEEYAKELANPANKYLVENKIFPKGYFDVSNVHDGYFSEDKKGRRLNTNGDSNADDTTYNRIMKDKEKLLSFDTPLRFIFSHSALAEGWDNPNVFQICTLVETNSDLKRRQKIGRGLRICVNQQGKRVMDPNLNRLTVVVNESYKTFCKELQRDYEKEGGSFGIIEETQFTNLSITNSVGTVKTLDQDQSVKIHKVLKDKGYIDAKNRPTEKFFKENEEHKFNINEEFRQFDEAVAAVIERFGTESVIKNAKTKIPVHRNTKVIKSEVFNEIWNKINQKTIYSVHLPIDEMKQKAIEYIDSMPVIKKLRVTATKGKVEYQSEGIRVQEGGISGTKTVATLSDFENYSYPDFIRRLCDSTSLLRITIIDILSKCNRLKDFYENPEQFIKQVTECINKAKKEKLIDGLQYSKIDEYYKQEEIFDDTDLFGFQDKNILDISNPDKNPLDHVIFDSQIEKTFAEQCDNDDEVLLYAKLPSKFKVDTPFGSYNPDWMVVIKSEGQEAKLYFVAETKGNTDLDKLRPDERNKILCGKKHFELLNKELSYKVVKTLLELKE